MIITTFSIVIIATIIRIISVQGQKVLGHIPPNVGALILRIGFGILYH